MRRQKPHQDFAGFRAERRNPITGGHTIILDCKLAEDQDCPIVENWREEGGRYQVLCNEHSTVVHVSSMAAARASMKDTEGFCDECRNMNENG